MKRFIRNLFIIVVPFIVWALVVVIIDPFNYFGLKVLSDKTKKSAEKLNQLMYRTIDCMHDPCENMIIGDSRIESLPINLIEKLSQKKYKKLSTNGTKLNEIFDLFYMANKRKRIRKVVIGINFNMFNKYGYQDRITGIQKVLKNPLMYIYNKDVAEAVYVTMEQIAMGRYVVDVPPMTKEEFWNWNIKTKASDWYGKYKFPDQLYGQLLNFDKFTKENGTEVIFIILPQHQDFHQRLVEFGLAEEEKRFKKIMSGLNAEVYDFDYLNSITANKDNFRDPVHYTVSVGDLMVREIWNKNLTIGKQLHLQ